MEVAVRPSLAALCDLEMAVRHRRDLRQVGDTDHLMALCNIGKFLGNLLGCPSADSGVDLVENQRSEPGPSPPAPS